MLVTSSTRIALGNGIEVTTDEGTLHLDPSKSTPSGVVSHAHLDHLTAGAHMTAPTLDFLRIRKPNASGTSLRYAEDARVSGVPFKLHDAGHIFGSAMIEAADGVLYTGDFSSTAGLTVGKAEPRACHTLITESTYGDPRFDLPPKELVMGSVERWVLKNLLSGPVALGAYPLGRAQELIKLLNNAGQMPIVSPDIAALTAVYNAHGHDLAYAVAGSPRAQELERSNPAWVVPRHWLKKSHDFTRKMRAESGNCAYLSGWCHLYTYFKNYDISAQFPLTDHATFRELLVFAAACEPKRVLTTHGYSTELAREISKKLRIPAAELR